MQYKKELGVNVKWALKGNVIMTAIIVSAALDKEAKQNVRPLKQYIYRVKVQKQEL